jgi:hypothetical protein
MQLSDLDYYQSPYMKADDLGGKEHVVTVANVRAETLGTQRKAVASFVGPYKPLPLNKTNGRELTKLFGANMEAWAGKRIALAPGTTRNPQGEVVGTVFVKAPRDEELNDAVPF